jgi:hypothetical protein
MMVLTHAIESGVIIPSYQFNGDTGNNYAIRHNLNGGSEGTAASQGKIQWQNAGTADTNFGVGRINNLQGIEKLVIQQGMKSDTGAGNAPNREQIVAKWANTSEQITTVNVMNTQSGDFAAGSEVVVLGCDNDEADTGTNFWQELASVELSSSSNTISSGTFAAKKYLMVVFYGNDANSGSATPRIRFNSDTGNNYADRTSNNGASDATSTSQSFAFISEADIDSGTLITFNIVNKSDKEKLFTGSGTRISSTGSSNVPSRFEFTGKWANTSAQITSIDVLAHHSVSSYKFNTGTYMKVYGAD